MTAFMHRIRLFVLALALAFAPVLIGGCACHRLGRVPSRFRTAQESGVAVIGHDYRFSAQTTINTDEPVLFTFASNENVAAGHMTPKYPRFVAYVNPEVAQLAPVDIKANFTQPFIEIFTGWAYLVGVSPMGGTTRVRAVGEGTRMIIEIDESVTPVVHRVYFVGDKGCLVRVHVPPEVEPPVYTMNAVGTYLEVYEAGATPPWSFKGPYSANAARAAFVASVLGETRDIGP
jgi:hypothetical protein